MSQLETVEWKQWGTCCDSRHQAVASRAGEKCNFPWASLIIDCLLALYLIRSGWNKTSWAVSWVLSWVRLLMFIRDGGKSQTRNIWVGSSRKGFLLLLLKCHMPPINYLNYEKCHYLYCDQDLITSDFTTNLQTFQTKRRTISTVNWYVISISTLDWIGHRNTK